MYSDMARTYHPSVAPPAVDQPSCNLSGCLDNQQAAEPFEQLEYGAGIAQSLVPSSQRNRLDDSIASKEPVGPAARLGAVRDVGEGAFNPGAAGIDREAVQSPDEEGGDDDPLRPAHEGGEEPAYARPFRRKELAGAVEDVEEEEGERVGQAGITAADVKGERDREHDTQQEYRAREATEKPPHYCGGRAVFARCLVVRTTRSAGRVRAVVTLS